MTVLRFFWRAVRRRPVLRVLLWIVVRLIGWFGWRRSVKLVFRQRRRGLAIALGLWRATVGLLRLGRLAWILIGWIRQHSPRLLGHRKETLQSQLFPERRGLRAPDTARSLHVRGTVGPNVSSRLARRRDELRRSVLAAIGVDPEWRPKRKPHARHSTAISSKSRRRVGDGISGPRSRTS